MPTAETRPTRARLDEGEVDPARAAPVEPPPRRFPPPAGAYVLLAAGLVGVFIVVWALGGFAQRTNALGRVPVGTLLSTGPYELRFTGATAQQHTDYQGKVSWRVAAVGEGRTTGDVTIVPDYFGDDGMFAAKDQASGEVQLPESQSFRPGGFVRSAAFTPGLPLQPFVVQFEFTRAFVPGDTVTFAVFDLEFRDNSLLGDQDPQWRSADTGNRLELPLTVLEPATS